MIRTRKRLRGLIILLIIALLAVSLIAVGSAMHSHKYQGAFVYETSDEIEELFKNNIQDFDEYVDKFYDHNMWDSYYEETHDDDFGNYKGFKKYTSKEEFDFLDSFYKKYHPAFWGRWSLEFYAHPANVMIIRNDEAIATYTDLLINRAEERNAAIHYYDEGWIVITYTSIEGDVS